MAPTSNRLRHQQRPPRRSSTRVTLWRRVTVIVAPFAIALPVRALPAWSQAAVSSAPKFEIASIKPNRSGAGGVRVQVQPGGRYSAVNVTLFQLIRDAYNLQNFQLTGGPGWLNVDHFDITAIAEGRTIPPPSGNDDRPDPLSLMIRALLADRFKVAVHTESRDGPVFALVLARSDRRLGPNLKSAGNCADAGGGRGNLEAATRACGFTMGPGTISAGGVTFSQTARTLSGQVRQIVLDKTGLSGAFDFDLRWTPEQPAQAKAADAGLPPADPNGAAIFTALQEQLGLKLEAQRGSVEMVVIDRAEQPSED